VFHIKTSVFPVTRREQTAETEPTAEEQSSTPARIKWWSKPGSLTPWLLGRKHPD